MSPTRDPQPSRSCAHCAHFENDPASIEKAFPGMQAMGSGFSSVKAGDGICRHHGLYLAMTDCCPDFLQRSLPSADGATVQDA